MINHKQIIKVLGFIMAAIMVVSCTSSGGTSAAQSTSTSEIRVGAPVTSQWFIEQFDKGIPTNWPQTGGWQPEESSIQTQEREQTLYIPGEWQNMVIKLRVKRSGEGWCSVGFRAQKTKDSPVVEDVNDDYLQFSFSKAEFIMSRKKAGATHGERLGGLSFGIDSGWHDLVITVSGDNIVAEWDGQPVIVAIGANVDRKGSIFLSNWDAGRVDIDFIEVAPLPEMAGETSGTQTTETAPGNSTTGSTTGNPALSGYDVGIEDIANNNGSFFAILVNYGLPLSGVSANLEYGAATTGANIGKTVINNLSMQTGEKRSYLIKPAGDVYQKATMPVTITAIILPNFVDINSANNYMKKIFGPPVVGGGSANMSQVDLAVVDLLMDSAFNDVVVTVANTGMENYIGTIKVTTFETGGSAKTRQWVTAIDVGSSAMFGTSYVLTCGSCPVTVSIDPGVFDTNLANNSMTKTLGQGSPLGGGSSGISPTETPLPPPPGGGSSGISPTETPLPPPAGGGQAGISTPTPTPTLEIFPVIIVIPP